VIKRNIARVLILRLSDIEVGTRGEKRAEYSTIRSGSSKEIMVLRSPCNLNRSWEKHKRNQENNDLGPVAEGLGR
jgi:hypothetical protein